MGNADLSAMTWIYIITSHVCGYAVARLDLSFGAIIHSNRFSDSQIFANSCLISNSLLVFPVLQTAK